MSVKVAWAVDLLYNTQRRRTCDQLKKWGDASVRCADASPRLRTNLSIEVWPAMLPLYIRSLIVFCVYFVFFLCLDIARGLSLIMQTNDGHEPSAFSFHNYVLLLSCCDKIKLLLSLSWVYTLSVITDLICSAALTSQHCAAVVDHL